jgi:hypothetical protein
MYIIINKYIYMNEYTSPERTFCSPNTMPGPIVSVWSPLISNLGFRVQGLGFRVWGFGGLGFTVWGSGFGV